jgi:hypothetical protein
MAPSRLGRQAGLYASTRITCNGIVRGLLAETYSQCIGDGPSYGLRPGASALSNLVQYWVSTDLNALAGIKPLN